MINKYFWKERGKGRGKGRRRKGREKGRKEGREEGEGEGGRGGQILYLSRRNILQMLISNGILEIFLY